MGVERERERKLEMWKKDEVLVCSSSLPLLQIQIEFTFDMMGDGALGPTPIEKFKQRTLFFFFLFSFFFFSGRVERESGSDSGGVAERGGEREREREREREVAVCGGYGETAPAVFSRAISPSS